MAFPKVLIVSNNPMSNENNMGKTLSSLFKNFPQESLAQLYFHSGKPTTNVCNNYYIFDDSEAVKSVFLRWKSGTHLNDINFENNQTKSFNYGVYEVGKKKKPIIYFARDIIWSLSNFKNKKILKWAKDFNPDFIFFASGDYSFAYKNVLWLSKKLNVKLLTMCFDDYYLNCEYYNRFLGKCYFKLFMKNVKRCISLSYKLFSISDLMSDEYSAFFEKKFVSLFTPSRHFAESMSIDNKSSVSYIGGLGLNRYKSLDDIGRIINSINSERLGTKIHIYTDRPPKTILEYIESSSFMEYEGKLSYKEVPDKIINSYAVIHTESFDNDISKRTRLSLSTKIADCLASGTLIIAYGPLEIASMKYLKDNNAGIVSNNPQEIKEKLIECLKDDNVYKKYIDSARNLAKLNHKVGRINELLDEK